MVFVVRNSSRLHAARRLGKWIGAVAFAMSLAEVFGQTDRPQGTIVSWGSPIVGANQSGNYIAVSAGHSHLLAIKVDGTIQAWGQYFATVPTLNSDFSAIAAGGNGSLGIKIDGTVVTWGTSGQGTVPAPNLAVAAGDVHRLRLTGDGTVAAWGCGAWCGEHCTWDVGQCDVPSPNADFIAIAAGYFHSLGLKRDGSIVPWGSNESGQLFGFGPNEGFVAVSGGSGHSLALKKDGSIIATGCTDYFFTDQAQCDVPMPNADFVSIAARGFHSLGLKADGSVVAWGSNSSGQSTVPSPNSGFISIAAGAQSSIAIRRIPGDGDADGDVGWVDLAAFDEAVMGPGVEPGLLGWKFWDTDLDGDIDLRDLGDWQNEFTGD